MDPDRHSELKVLRPDLLRFARLQTRNAGAAVDSGQETQLAALPSGRRFGSGSNP